MKTKIKKSELKEAFNRGLVQSSNLRTFLRKSGFRLSQKKIEQSLSYLLTFELEKAQKNRIKERKKEAKKLKVSYQEYINLREKALEIISDFHTGHSMGCYRSIAITNRIVGKIRNDIIVPFTFENHDIQEYAKSCKYKPTYGSLQLGMKLEELRKIEKIENIWTIPAPNNKCKVLIAVGQKQTYNVKFENYYLVGNSHGASLREAKLTHMKRVNFTRYQKLSDMQFVGIQHFINAGACRIGINHFCKRHNLNPEYGYNLGYLRSLEPTNTWLS